MPQPEGSVLHEEHQHFMRPAVALALCVVILVADMALVAYILKSTPAGAGGRTAAVAAALVALSCVGTIALMMLLRMETQVRTRGVYVRMRPLPWAHITPESIVAHRAVTYRPLRDYGGWGLRRTLRGDRAYNASGNRGVRLEFADGRHVLVGSQDADRLDRAVAGIPGLGAKA